MPTRTSYEHGMFSWVELATSDAEAAKKYYGALFDWTFVDMPAGPDMTYTMCKLGGQDVAALYKIGKSMQGVPPHWTSYITVDDVDARTKKAEESGGTVISQPFDVMEVGRMAVIQDPSGATFAFWQPKTHIGASVLNEPGSLCWNELMTTDADAARDFYVNTLGWATEAIDMGPMGTYTLFQRPHANKQGNLGGMMNMPPNMAGVPSHWLVYFAVTDCDASTDEARAVGGSVLAAPADIPNIGRFSVVRDPQGAVFALFKLMH